MYNNKRKTLIFEINIIFLLKFCLIFVKLKLYLSSCTENRSTVRCHRNYRTIRYNVKMAFFAIPAINAQQMNYNNFIKQKQLR